MLRYLFWPRLKRDVSRHIKACHTCQTKGKPKRGEKSAPLCPIPASVQPFERLIVDAVMPSEPLRIHKDYVNGVRHRGYSAGGMAKEKLSSSQVGRKLLYERKTEQRSFSPEGQVLVLVPRASLPFLEKHSGTFYVLGQGTDQNCLLSTPKSRLGRKGLQEESLQEESPI